MQENELGFLPHFLQEEIYVLDKAGRAPRSVPPPQAVATPPSPSTDTAKPSGMEVPTPDPPRVEVVKPAVSLPHPTVVAIHQLSTAFGAAERELLQKMLKAVNRPFDQVTLLEAPQLVEAYALMAAQSTSYRVLAFGETQAFRHESHAPEPYRIYKVNRSGILLADPLAMLQGNDTLKKKLWVEMQILFK
jgi:hypothetical protein